MHKTITMKSKFAAAVAGASLLLIAGSAFAVTVPGFAGKPELGSDAACLNVNGAAMLNQCGRQIIYKIPLVVNAGSKTVTVRTNNPGGGTFSCQLIVSSPFATTTPVFPNVGIQTFSLGINVPSNANLQIFCQVNPGGQVIDVNYNQ